MEWTLLENHSESGVWQELSVQCELDPTNPEDSFRRIVAYMDDNDGSNSTPVALHKIGDNWVQVSKYTYPDTPEVEYTMTIVWGPNTDEFISGAWLADPSKVIELAITVYANTEADKLRRELDLVNVDFAMRQVGQLADDAALDAITKLRGIIAPKKRFSDRFRKGAKL